MSSITTKAISWPLEREYEAWIAADIERYFESIKVKAEVWSISPRAEAIWPADLAVQFPAKLVGLQVKRPIEAPPTKAGNMGLSRLKWSLAKPSGQFSLVARNSYIYYCLPTFLNRAYRKEALSHAVFWRPNKEALPHSDVWYDNEDAQSPSIGHEMRWGRFVERVVSCKIGFRVESPQDIDKFMSEIFRSAASQADKSDGDSIRDALTAVIFATPCQQ